MWVKVVTWLLALLFIVPAGLPKLLGAAQAVEGFEQMGYPNWFRILIGALEVGGGIALLVPAIRLLGVLVLLVIMVGATWTMISSGQPPVPPIAVGALLVLVGWKSMTARD